MAVNVNVVSITFRHNNKAEAQLSQGPCYHINCQISHSLSDLFLEVFNVIDNISIHPVFNIAPKKKELGEIWRPPNVVSRYALTCLDHCGGGSILLEYRFSIWPVERIAQVSIMCR